MLSKPRKLCFGWQWEWFFSLTTWALPFHISVLKCPAYGKYGDSWSIGIGFLCIGISIFKEKVSW